MSGKSYTRLEMSFEAGKAVGAEELRKSLRCNCCRYYNERDYMTFICEKFGLLPESFNGCIDHEPMEEQK